MLMMVLQMQKWWLDIGQCLCWKAPVFFSSSLFRCVEPEQTPECLVISGRLRLFIIWLDTK